MSLSSALEVGIGLILVYYTLSTFVSAITSQVTKIINLRARNLANGLYDMLSDSERYDELMNHALIRNLEKKKVTLFGTVAVQGVNVIPGQTFALALFDILAPQSKDEDNAVDVLKASVAALPPGKTRDSLLSLLNSGIMTVGQARLAVTDWFDDAMEGVSELYAQYARRIVFFVAAVVTIVFGIDTIDIARTLWEQPTVRAAAVAEVDELIQDESANIDAEQALSDLEALDIPIFWDFNELPTNAQGWALKVAGLIISWIAAAQGAPFWYDLLKRIKSSA